MRWVSSQFCHLHAVIIVSWNTIRATIGELADIDIDIDGECRPVMARSLVLSWFATDAKPE